mmetsp:Transcript_37301/g.60648  ORF Transcript_37301/g.60648 Transcript_37301/m.60648 type:complete len:150 (+) Transcript_37301:50-499(+)
MGKTPGKKTPAKKKASKCDALWEDSSKEMVLCLGRLIELRRVGSECGNAERFTVRLGGVERLEVGGQDDAESRDFYQDEEKVLFQLKSVLLPKLQDALHGLSESRFEDLESKYTAYELAETICRSLNVDTTCDVLETYRLTLRSLLTPS